MLSRLVVLLLAWTGAAGQLPDARDALRLGRTQDETLYAAFSKGYSLSPADPVSSAEIITPFRRAVLIVRERARLADLGFTEYDLANAMKPHVGQITFVVQVLLHPFNTYQTAPAYDLYISTGSDSPPLAAGTIAREPIYALGGPGSPLIGVRLEITLPQAKIAAAPAPELIVTNERADVVWRARVDLTRFR